jgi:hypothetical protein
MRLRVIPGTPWCLWVPPGGLAQVSGTDRSGLLLVATPEGVGTRQLMDATAQANARRVQARVPEVRP